MTDRPMTAGERKIVSVLFCDLVESTALAERLDPEALQRVQDAYFDPMRSLVEQHGGTVEKFIGDAIVAVFGVPLIHEDDAERAVRCALAMRDALEGLNDTFRPSFGVELAVRIGVDTGEAVTGGRDDRAIATGDVTNTAARLEQSAKPGDVLVGRETFLLTERVIDYEDRPEVAVKGKAESLAIWAALGASAGLRRPRSPMMGREAELKALAGALERAVAVGKPQVVVVLGEPGIGKSRLVEEFAARAEGRARVLRGASLPYGEGTVWRPVAELVRSEVGIHESEPPEVALARLAERLVERHQADEASFIEAQIGPLLGASRASGTSGPEILWALRRYLDALARTGPLVILLDDLHWADRILLETIQELAETLGSGAVVFILLGRPELRERLTGLGEGSQILSLEPLPESQALMLVTHLSKATGGDWSQDQEEDIVQRAQGNPLFLEEIGAMVGEQGAGDRPRTLHALLAARIDLLPREAKSVAQAGAVVGDVFWDGAVGALLDGEDVAAAVRLLRTRGLVDEEEETAFLGHRQLRFHHNLIREVAYESLPKGERSRMHQRIAGWLESRAKDRPDLWVSVAHHLDRAVALAVEVAPLESPDPDLADATAEAYLRAAQWTALNAALPEAADMLRRGADVAATPEVSDVCRARLAHALALAGQADEAVREAEAVLSRDVSRRAAAIAALAQAQAAYDRGDFEDLLRALAERALELARAESLVDVEARALELLGWHELWSTADPEGFRGAEKQWRQAADVAMDAGDLAGAARMIGWLAALGATVALELRAAEEAGERAMELARSSGSLRAMAVPHLGMAWVRLHQDRLEETVEHSREALRLSLDSGDRVEAVAASAFVLAPPLRLLGRLEESLEVVELGMSISEEMGGFGWDPNLRIERGLTLLALGRLHEADEELARVRPIDHTDWMSMTSALAELRAAQGKDKEAESLWREVVGGSPGQSRYQAVDAAVGLARFLGERGRHAEAREILDQARSLLEDTEAPFLVRRIREVEETLPEA